MKTLKYIIILGFFIFNSKCYAQLPLVFGDGIITHSPNSMSAGTPFVVATIKTSNTSTAPLGSNWNTPSMVPPGTKPANWSAVNWTPAVLGNVFGITLDANPNPNIYVSNTQIYGMPALGKRGKIWRLDGVTAANTLVFDFNNVNYSLGNLKYKKIGTVENIYVSNWDNGNIERLNGNSTSTIAWSLQAPFNPKFGLYNDNKDFLPYGLALRNMSGGTFRLYYAKISRTGTFNTNQVWSVNLNSSGDFIAGSETQESFPTTELTNYTGTVIADIAFTEDGKKMLLGQQSFNTFGALCAHRSNVAELEATVTDHIWTASPNLFHAGQSSGFGSACGGAAGDWNSIGGVSYSDNILNKNATSFQCDDTVWFVSDAIVFSPTFAYGVQGMKANGGASNSVTNSVIIDEDDFTGNTDKMQLGDVEIYKNPINCAPCKCGKWESIALGNNSSWWTNSSTPPAPLPTLSFNQGAATGILFPHYNCQGNCSATFTYNLIKSNGTSTPLSGSTSLDLGQTSIKNLPCGSYFIMITPKCGNTECPPVRIPLVIICPPPCTDCGAQSSVTAEGTPVYQNGMVSGNFIINNSTPVSEVRFLVEEFRLTSSNGNENCILCKNPPKSWGSIQSAVLSAISPAFSSAVTIDNREAVFNNGGLIAMPGTLGFSLALPQTTGLECCTLKAEICVKITIRDVNCCEKEILKCFTVNLN